MIIAKLYAVTLIICGLKKIVTALLDYIVCEEVWQ